MRIAYVVNSLEGGGAMSMVPSVANFFRSRGHQFHLFALTARNRRGEAGLIDAGVDYSIRQGGEKDHLAAYRWLGDQLPRWKPTHLWTSLSRATLIGQPLGLRLGIPVISWQHNAFLKPINLRLLQATSRLSALWVGDSRYVTELTRTRLRLSAQRVVCWPVFRADPPQEPRGNWKPGDTVRVGSLGRLHVSKGYDALLDAVKILRSCSTVPPFEITIAGEGHEREKLQHIISNESLHQVRLHGFTDSSGQFLQKQHLYIQPSIREGFCIGAHEAMQAGLAVVGSAVGEMQYSIEEGITGWRAEPGSPTDIARALKAALSQPERLATMGAQAQARVLERFGAEKFDAAGDAVIDVIEQLRPAPAP